jgi:hypothetical protein
MIRKQISRALTFASAAVLLAAGSVWAQTTTQGAIAGTVMDATNAAVPNAKVLIHNPQTNADLTLTSNGSGYYKAPELAPGSYTVTVSASGFSTVKTNDVVVEVNITTELNPHLAAGGESQTVEVNAAPPVLDFESATYGGHLENTDIENLPINNRRWSTLALLSPGITVDTSGFGLLQFHAISPLLNNVEIDGADDNQAFFSEERGRTRAGYSTSQAMIQEFQINTGVYGAEFGRAVGGVINSVTKQGTNKIHGEAYFFNRKSSRAAFVPLSTITTFNAATNAYVTSPYKPSDNRNEFGFQAGGPLLKDKLFWNYAFDMFRRNFPGTAKVNTPTTFFTNATAGAPGNGGTCNTATGTVSTPAGGKAASSTDAAACVLAARLNVTAPGTQTYATGATLYNSQLQNFLTDLGSVPRFGDQEINTPKLDYQLGTKHHVSLLYHRLRWDSPGGVQTQGTNNYGIDTFGTDFVKLDYGLAKLDSQLTSRMTNELRYQYGRELNDEGQQPFSNYSRTNLTATNGNVPEINLLGSSTGFYFGSPYYSYRVAYPDERKWQVGDTVTFLFGRHSLKFGEDVVHNYDLQNNLYESNGYYSYGSIQNYFSDLVSKGKTCDSGGNGVGTAAGGFYPCYSSYAQSFGQPVLALSTLDYGVFAQDDWKLTPHLTLNLGVRYDYEMLPAPFAPNPAVSQTTTTPSDKNNIAPRIGFAWDPFGLGKTTVHAGYGFYYGRIFNALLLNALENTGVGTTGTTPTSQAAYSFSSTTAAAPLLPTQATTLPPAGAIGPSIEYLDPHLQNPYTQQFDFAIQQDIGANTILSVSYLGSLGRELPNYLNLDLNPASAYTINYTIAPATGTTNCGPAACGTVIPTKVYANRVQTGATSSTYNYTLLNPAYNGITDVISNVNSSYHALTFEVQRRAGKYLAFDGNYTWSHALDFAQNASTSFTAGSNSWFDPYGNPRTDSVYGNSNFNIPNRVVAWALLNAPGVSKGSAWHYLANGWSLKPVVQMQNGFPYSVSLGTSTTPNQCGYAGCLLSAGSGLSGTGVSYIPYFGRNSQKYPITTFVDARVEKDFDFGEGYHLQVMAEGFNLGNHDNITGLNTSAYTLSNTIPTAGPATSTSNLVYSTSYGSVTSANSNYAIGPRQIQLSARFQF